MSEWFCSRHGTYGDDRVASIGSQVDEQANLIADQCAMCIIECEEETW